ncbi:MAG: hypothetical protein ACRENG_15350, partial [bacterium]
MNFALKNLRGRQMRKVGLRILLTTIWWLSGNMIGMAQISEGEIRADINRVARASHGIDFMSGAEIRNILAKIKSTPSEYLSVIRQDLVLPAANDSLADRNYIDYYECLTTLAWQIGNQEAKDLLKQTYFATAERLESLRTELSIAKEISAPPEEIDLIESAEGAVIYFQGDIIRHLTSLKDNSILSDCLDRIESESHTILYPVMFDYFEEVGVEDATVRSRLEAMFLDANSPFYDHPRLEITLVNLGSQLFVPPSLISLDPDTVTIGSGDFTLTVMGTNFFNGAAV